MHVDCQLQRFGDLSQTSKQWAARAQFNAPVIAAVELVLLDWAQNRPVPPHDPSFITYTLLEGDLSPQHASQPPATVEKSTSRDGDVDVPERSDSSASAADTDSGEDSDESWVSELEDGLMQHTEPKVSAGDSPSAAHSEGECKPGPFSTKLATQRADIFVRDGTKLRIDEQQINRIRNITWKINRGHEFTPFRAFMVCRRVNVAIFFSRHSEPARCGR